MNALESAVRKAKRGLGLSSNSPLVKAVRPAYDTLLKAMYGRAGIERRIHGEPPLRLQPQYRAIGEDCEPEVFAALKSGTHPGGVVLDVGANIGMYSLLMARWVGDGGRIYAFEPAPEPLRALREHVALNNFSDRIEVIGQAVSDVSGEATFYAHASNGENSLNPDYAKRVAVAEAVRVPITTIDDFCRHRGIRPTLLKIDIEGFEFHALRGAVETLSQYRPTVIIELHPHIWPEIGLTREQAAAILLELNCRAVALDGQADPLAQFGHVMLEHIS